jgi:hypothetical protein
MDPLDPAVLGADGTTCAVCEGSVPAGSVELLASRDDLAFVQVRCDACHSTTLAFVLGAAPPTDAAAPVTADDVLDMHRLLDGWQGGLRELLARKSGKEAGRGPAGAGPRS